MWRPAAEALRQGEWQQRSKQAARGAGGSISGRVGDTGKACDAGRVGGVGGGNARAAPVAEQARGRGSGWRSHRSGADAWRRQRAAHRGEADVQPRGERCGPAAAVGRGEGGERGDGRIWSKSKGYD